MTKLSDTQLVLLSNAAKREDGALTRPAKAHPPALANAIKILMARGLILKTEAAASLPAWGDEEDGARYALCITPAGLDAIGVDDNVRPEPATAAAPSSPKSDRPPAEDELHRPATTGRKSAKRTAKVQIGGKSNNGKAESEKAIRVHAPADKGDVPHENPPRRPGSKLATVVDMLRAPQGASIAAIMKATDWQAHSVRGAIAGAIKKRLGLNVVSERLGDERVYRIAR